jgi:glutathione peroxidase
MSLFRLALPLIICITGWILSTQAEDSLKKEVGAVLNFRMNNIQGKEVYLGDYRGKVLLLVNVASQCGLTPQYEGLEALYRKYKEQGFQILAFPANNFSAQEPGTNQEILTFCKTKYDVTFDVFAKISVKGEDQCELYRFLTDEQKNPGFGGEVPWNFQKYLVSHEGKVIGKFAPQVEPSADELTKAIEAALKQTP